MKKYFDNGSALRDVGMLLFLISMLGAVLIVILAPQQSQMTYLLLLGASFIGITLGIFGRTSAAIILAGSQVCIWTAYRLFSLILDGTPINFPFDYLWIPAPLLLVSGVCIFQYGNERLEIENNLLRSQVEDLVMVDPVTGLNNLRALYREIPAATSLSSRHGRPLSLMIIQIRYYQELRTFLSQRQFNMLCRSLTEIITNLLRLEDKLFSIDDHGTVAALLITDAEGCEIVKTRLRAAVENPKAFNGIAKDNLVVSLRFAYKLCDKNSGTPIEMKLSVENELAYDV